MDAEACFKSAIALDFEHPQEVEDARPGREVRGTDGAPYTVAMACAERFSKATADAREKSKVDMAAENGKTL